MLLDMMTNEITRQSHVATTLQLPFFLGASSIERVIYECHWVFVLWNKWKNLLPTNKKMKKKKQIPDYHTPSLERYDEEIWDQSMKNLLTQGEYWRRKPKNPWSVIDEKTS